MEALILYAFTNYGIYGAGLFLLIISILKYHTWILTKLQHIVKEENYYRPKGVLISKLTYWIDFRLGNIQLTDPARKQIFSDLLIINFRTIRNNLFKIEDNKDFDSLSSTQLYTSIIDCISNIRETYEKEASNNGIPEIVIKKFYKWHSSTIQYALISSEIICSSMVYSNNRDRMQAIYSMYIAILEITIAEAERSLNELNGELSGFEYRGLVCK